MSSLQEVYVSVKGLIATNLSTMGVTGYSSSDGLTTLANAILEVEGGSDLTITLDLQSSSSSIVTGQTVNLTATLSATYDGETVDLNSVLQNAPITFKEGNTTINTVSTNANGVATISNYAPVGTGIVTLSAQFPTTDGFDGATDVITITVEDVPETLTLTADKSILSYADSESAILTATYSGGTGATVQLYDDSDDSLIGTMTDNLDGTYSYTYASTGVGDISFYAKVGSLVSEIFGVQDCRFFDVSSSENVSKYGSSSSFSYDSTEQAYYITTSSAKNIIRDSVVGDFDFEISMDFKLANGNTNFYCGESTTGYECQGQITGSSISIKGVRTYYTDSSRSISGRQYHGSYTLTNSKWYTYKVTRVSNTLTAQILDGDTVIATATDSDVRGTSNNVSWHNYVVTGQMYWKNIKFKPL